MSDWILIEDRLPEFGVQCLWTDGAAYWVDDMNKYDKACITGDEYSPYWSPVVAWLPIPDLPEALKDE